MIRDFRDTDWPDYRSMSEDFYASEAVAFAACAENFRTTFDLVMQGSPLVRGLILEQNEKTAGYGLLSFMYSNEAGGLVVWLEELYILPEYRGQGLGRAFFTFVHEQYRNTARRFRLEVMPNHSVIPLYRSLGYDEIPYLMLGWDTP